ncbi:hypothetical protein DAPPUDRAFT_253444 [Daphnia pulex]|uniref:SNTX MACPF/CDC-like domain-containing protein n=1 Tax=Daphnia pulex TaxID=6669 RepID=E9H4U7_DAPPU|nr:hypothetical protein DAPPUDRAFT_253444 [Daphnia pulex]|eukprot:EFX73292.1 hypothetical protein DAPPUDRAFT_253444 [Daphnia pulex]
MSITEASTKILKIPALERDFREGALYDARNEKTVLGYSLWDADDLKKIEVRRNDKAVYLMNASDTLSEKFSGVKMSASVQLSVLSGLIKLGGGSAAYLKKEINTVGECSVQVRCFFKTGYKEMGMDQLTNIRYPDVARTGNKNSATHFVMKIQYGAGAIFTFKKQFQSSEKDWQVKAKAELQICGKTITSLLDGSYERNYRNYSSHSQIKCEFQSFGLSLSKALPTTYDEAVKFAGSFAETAQQSFARQGGEALGIPCIVWLSPLVSLEGCTDAPRLYYDFTLHQASVWIKFLEDCDSLIETKLDLPPIRFGLLMETTKEFEWRWRLKKEFINQLRSESTAELREMIVAIRSGLIPIDCFNNKMSCSELHLGSVTQWMKEQKEKFPHLRDEFNRLGW